MKIRENYINRCVQLAENGLGKTYPNPMVGSVIVHRNRIIGEGWHRQAGAPHAEVNAINSVKDKNLLPSSTIYVSLEPCSHYGKTPPCSDLIIASGIKKVVIGTVDPFAEVAGRGIKKLMDAGCQVNVGVLEQECRELNRRFFTFHQQERPYIILKWAESADGFLSPEQIYSRERKPVWITNRYSQQLVHKWRTEEQAILVGTTTAITDNPSLTARKWQGPNPVRIVLDRQLRIPRDSALFDGSTKTTVLTASEAAGNTIERTSFESLNFREPLPEQIAAVLYKQGLQSVIVEGGRKTLQSFIDANYWDEARILQGRSIFEKGTRAPSLHGRKVQESRLGTDSIRIYRND